MEFSDTKPTSNIHSAGRSGIKIHDASYRYTSKNYTTVNNTKRHGMEFGDIKLITLWAMLDEVE